MTDPFTPPEIDHFLSRMYGDKAEKIAFYCFDVPRWGITIDESRMYEAWVSRAGGEPDAKTLANVAEAFGLETEVFARTLLEQGADIILPSSADQRGEASLAWLAWCLNNRNIKIDDRAVTVEQLKRLLPVDAVKTFMRLFGPEKTADEGNAKGS